MNEISERQGRVAIVGAGPGDPELLTLRAARLLAAAEAVVYDRLVSDEVLALCAPGCRRLYAGKAAGRHFMRQEEINALLVDLAREGLRVVRLKGGDPFLFGRGGEEALALRAAGVPFEVVPGVTSAFAAPAYAGVPVTHRGLAASVTVVTAHEDPGKSAPEVDYAHLARSRGTLVFLMGARAIGLIAWALTENGMTPDTPAAIVESAATGAQRAFRTTLAGAARTAAHEEVCPPAVFVVGEVAALADRLDWFDPQGRPAVPWRRAAATLLDETPAPAAGPGPKDRRVP